MDHALAFWDSPFINFRHFDFPDGLGHGYRWVHIKRFHLPPASPADQDLLAALIAHPEFRDTYDGSRRLARTAPRPVAVRSDRSQHIHGRRRDEGGRHDPHMGHQWRPASP
ncbi:hypothetical protein [Streptomyces sp. NBC_01264]|uniref:hypothetical protein n=1 Tax=Streptomyces sp. NBC_01264 TaxID=2903804 RepID=UPI0022595A6F|nr:hypothetical protein [Streptomyces sp. NBC_01264]MCX4781501.1 hypothetical protein [Streptomyces sp. NBC_01264]